MHLLWFPLVLILSLVGCEQATESSVSGASAPDVQILQTAGGTMGTNYEVKIALASR
ncbi:MAG: hypothetical protein R3C05_16050 [Pirellulaceae bacterium]